MDIHASYTYDLRTVKAIQKQLGRTRKIVFFVLFGLFTVTCAYDFIMDLVRHRPVGNSACFFFIALVMLAAFLVGIACAPKRTLKQLGSRAGRTVELTFHDDYFETSSSAAGFEGRTAQYYSQLVKVVETPEFFIFFETSRMVMPVDKATITGGTAEQLAERLRVAVTDKYVVQK